MLRGLWKLTWLETKIFLREPLGAFGPIVLPVMMYALIGRFLGGRARSSPPTGAMGEFVAVRIPVIAAIMIGVTAVLSLITIIAVYREGGILKRLRATPLRPTTILSAHVIVKLMLTAATVVVMVLAGRRYYPADMQIPVLSFSLALVIGTFSILSIGFLISSLVPTARFAQPIGGAMFYPMLALSGLFFPIDALQPAMRTVARLMPTTYVVSLLEGILKGDRWSAHRGDILALAVAFAVCTALSARVFRWE
jgi:ABC-2 type transport system permease protein